MLGPSRRWESSGAPRRGVEQRGYDQIGVLIRHWRTRARLSQRDLERLTGIDQTVISRLENGKQYGLRWRRFAILVGVLEGLQPISPADPSAGRPAPPPDAAPPALG